MEDSGKPGEVVEAAATPPAVVNSSEEEKTAEDVKSTAEDHAPAKPSLVNEGEELALAAAASEQKKEPESSVSEAGEDNNLPKSDEAVAESVAAAAAAAKPSDGETVVASREPQAAELDVNSRSTTHHPPFVAFSAGTRASWTNCCVTRAPDYNPQYRSLPA